MEPAFVSHVGIGLRGGHHQLSVSKKSTRVTVAGRQNARMMAVDSSGDKQTIGQWFLDRFMHNFGNDYGYETYFKPAEKAREDEVKRVRERVDNDKSE